MVPPAFARARWTPRLLSLAIASMAILPATPTHAQTLDDGFFVNPRELRVGVDYAADRWDRYWEGTLKRDNDNIGTLTTQRVGWNAAYGVSRKLSVFATLPYVHTTASEGVLSPMHGFQDLTGAAKLRLLRLTPGGRSTLIASAIVGGSVPTSDYTPDFLPLSIGLGSKSAFVRGVVQVHDRTGWFANAEAGHAWRSTVHLNRPAYYTDGQLVMSDEVAMPDVADYGAAAGYQLGRWCIPVGVMAQRTLGGGDIRRQDMPFVSNRMNFTKAHAEMMYTLPLPSAVTLGVGASRVLSGRNVGQSTMIMGGVTYAFTL
jgi:hypothetical protein